MAKIGIDLMGGDFAPVSVLEGVKLASSQLKEEKVILFGNAEKVKSKAPELFNQVIQNNNVEFVEASQVIENNDSPTRAFSTKPDSSITKGFGFLKNDKIDVFISTGNTGAMLVGAMYSIKLIDGIIRPAISTLIPRTHGGYGLLIDVGFNPDARQDVLFQFGLLGSVYLKSVYGISDPKVGLMNIGSEKGKGNLVAQAAYELMEETEKYHFIGNIEGYDLLSSKADIIVCDGYTGNILLKAMEGFHQMIMKRDVKDPYFDMFNYENYGGTPILGINKPVVVGHGVSSPKAFQAMIQSSLSVIKNSMIQKIRQTLGVQNND